MFTEGLFALAGLTISLAVFLKWNIKKKIDRAWIASNVTMVVFLILCMAAGILASYFVLHVMTQFLSISEYSMHQKFLILFILTFTFCLTNYIVLYRPVFKEWHDIVKETISEKRIENLRIIVNELDADVTRILRDTPPNEFTEFTLSRQLLKY